MRVVGLIQPKLKKEDSKEPVIEEKIKLEKKSK